MRSSGRLRHDTALEERLTLSKESGVIGVQLSHELSHTEQASDGPRKHEYPAEDKRSRKWENEHDHAHYDDDC